jgi:hypothetical protein
VVSTIEVRGDKVVLSLAAPLTLTLKICWVKARLSGLTTIRVFHVFLHSLCE